MFLSPFSPRYLVETTIFQRGGVFDASPIDSSASAHWPLRPDNESSEAAAGIHEEWWLNQSTESTTMIEQWTIIDHHEDIDAMM